MASAAAEAEKGSPAVVGLLVVGNIIILLSGLALFAETVWVTADQYHVYPLMGVSGKDDVFAGAWIAIFCGFSFFVVASFGVGATLCRRRSMILTYLVLMLVVYIFECASCITAYTHRDYMVSSPALITQQMLTFYGADSAQGRELTRLWDRIMMEVPGNSAAAPRAPWTGSTSHRPSGRPPRRGCSLGPLCAVAGQATSSPSVKKAAAWATWTTCSPRAASSTSAMPSTATRGASRGLGLPS